jgi:TM2 domain-containing membrane protein YozV
MKTQYKSDDPSAIIAQEEYNTKRRYPFIAWALWALFGAIGGHRYYLKSYGMAITMTLFFIGCCLLWFLVIPVLFPFIWAIIDAFFIEQRLYTTNRKIYSKMYQKHGTMLNNPFI